MTTNPKLQEIVGKLLLDLRVKAISVYERHLVQQALTEYSAELEKKVGQLADTLRLLHDYQNGCPLPKYEPYWTKAMADAEKLLDELGK